MWRLATLPFLIHGAGMILDEARFHRRRGLPRWERLGHPLDTLTVFVCYALALSLPPTAHGLTAYLAASALSCLCITKDEWMASIASRLGDPLHQLPQPHVLGRLAQHLGKELRHREVRHRPTT